MSKAEEIKDFIYINSQELAEAIDNGYDLRMSEPEIFYWMGKFAEHRIKQEREKWEKELEEKSFEISFGDRLRCGIAINKNDPRVFYAINGFGTPVKIQDIKIENITIKPPTK